jgi:hypothetical protein
LDSIVRQVDRLYLYLDGHREIPAAARNDSRVVPILRREAPSLAGNGKFLGMTRESEPCLYLGVDDDIAYPPNYVAKLRAGLEAQGRPAVVGFHGVLLPGPFKSYLRDRTVFFFASGLDQTKEVDALGTGTVMFSTGDLNFDVRMWPHINKNDLCLAREAVKAKLPLICLAREENFLCPLEREQADSIYAALKKDDRLATILAIELMALKSRHACYAHE